MTETPVAPRVAVKDVPPCDVVFVRERVAVRDIPRLFATVVEKAHGRGTGAPVAIYHDAIFGSEAVDVEVVVPVAADEAEETLMPATVAALTHRGPYERIGETYGQLAAWVAAHGMRQFGAIREVYLVGPGDVGDPAGYVTEVQMPVELHGLGEA